MSLPAVVFGTATLLCRPLRFLFDIESRVAVLHHDGKDDDSTVLGHVRIHLSLSCPDNHDTNPPDDITGLVGRFIAMRIRLEVEDITMQPWRVQYQLSPATESYLFPADHTNVFRVLVTDDFITHISTTALQFNFLPPKPHEDGMRQAINETVATPRLVVPPVGSMSAEEAEAARRLTEDAANAAQTAALAAREAARAATSAMEDAKAAVHQRLTDHDVETRASVLARDRQREKEFETELARERERAREAAAQAKDHEVAAYALEKQQYEHKLTRLSDEQQRLREDAVRLAQELDEKANAMGQWNQQTASMDAALELLKKRLESDAHERDELTRRLHVLEEEKLELMRKSRTCNVQ